MGHLLGAKGQEAEEGDYRGEGAHRETSRAPPGDASAAKTARALRAEGLQGQACTARAAMRGG